MSAAAALALLERAETTHQRADWRQAARALGAVVAGLPSAEGATRDDTPDRVAADVEPRRKESVVSALALAGSGEASNLRDLSAIKPRWSVSAPGYHVQAVAGLRPRVEVRGVSARRGVAGVQDVQAVGHRAEVQDEREPMHVDASSFAVDVSVPLGIGGAGPEPTPAVGFEFEHGEEAFDGPRSRSGAHHRLTLIEFLAEYGIRDPGGELRGRDLDKWHRQKVFRKRLVRDDGRLSLEAAAEAAFEAGYFDQVPWSDMDRCPVTDDMLIAAIEREACGDFRRLYPRHDLREAG